MLDRDRPKEPNWNGRAGASAAIIGRLGHSLALSARRGPGFRLAVGTLETFERLERLVVTPGAT